VWTVTEKEKKMCHGKAQANEKKGQEYKKKGKSSREGSMWGLRETSKKTATEEFKKGRSYKTYVVKGSSGV